MPLAHRFVEALNGTIEVVSIPKGAGKRSAWNRFYNKSPQIYRQSSLKVLKKPSYASL